MDRFGGQLEGAPLNWREGWERRSRPVGKIGIPTDLLFIRRISASSIRVPIWATAGQYFSLIPIVNATPLTRAKGFGLMHPDWIRCSEIPLKPFRHAVNCSKNGRSG